MERSGKRETKSFGYFNPDRVGGGERGFVDVLIYIRGGLLVVVWGWFGARVVCGGLG